MSTVVHARDASVLMCMLACDVCSKQEEGKEHMEKQACFMLHVSTFS